MKSLSVLATVALVAVGTAVIGCAGRTVEFTGKDLEDSETLEKRDNLLYEVDSETPFTGQVVIFYPDGQEWMEIKFRDGLPHGEMVEWYENGQNKQEIEFRDGSEHGERIYWYENGQKMMEAAYRDGTLHGEIAMWHENGRKMAEGEYRDGEIIREEYWDEDGNTADYDSLNIPF